HHLCTASAQQLDVANATVDARPETGDDFANGDQLWQLQCADALSQCLHVNAPLLADAVFGAVGNARPDELQTRLIVNERAVQHVGDGLPFGGAEFRSQLGDQQQEVGGDLVDPAAAVVFVASQDSGDRLAGVDGE